MDFKSCTSTNLKPLIHLKPPGVLNKVPEYTRSDGRERAAGPAVVANADIDLREVYFLILRFLSAGPCQNTYSQFLKELTEHQLLPRRYHAWCSRTRMHSDYENDDGVSIPLTYEKLLDRYPHIAKDHLVKLLKQLMFGSPRPSHGMDNGPNAADVPTLLGTGSFSLLKCDKNEKKQVKLLPRYLRWPHMQIDQVHGLHLRAIGGGFTRHHRASSIHAACYAIAKPSTMVQKMQNITRLRGHRNAVYCAIFDRSGRYVITGSDDRLVKIWSMETAFCLGSCRGHEGDITDLAVSSNNALVASASNDFVIRVWRLPDGYPISILQGHTGAVTAIAFSPRTGAAYQLLSSSDDGTCRLWDARSSHCKPRIYVPNPVEAGTGIAQQNHQILCCAYNANGTVFVTGSSDTFARVWNAYKSSPDDSDEPHHEIDLLAGHENDVNYVQFSGCAITARSGTSDALKDDHSLKFKNSWFSHDNIVTCSRDGSAIIWVPRSRRSYGKVGRWTKAYHLKVPPPPLPPQPPRGGPRRRILPTPRGVNMIMWSLDNRFVLAAIMDCRICVWNAADGSLVHCLTGHTESTYVLDVHPFNPRVAMSAGYDGKTIIWDIWEGTPVRVFEIGRGKLVDGKFSSDGTSIVLSDDVGQIYLINTGQGESHKDAKYDQFFLGDYRPLVRDALGNVLDQESQLLPYQRNIQDPLCDSSMIPYPEPYQSMYQRQRLGVLGVEWRPPSQRFAIGPDFSLGEEYQMMPLPDPEVLIDVPEPLDATFWEPENEVIPDDTDSEYDIDEELPSIKEQETSSTSSYGNSDSDAEGFEHDQRQNDVLRRSKRKNDKAEAEYATPGRRTRRKRVEDCNGSSSKKSKKSKRGTKATRKKSPKPKMSRPQRVAARNALNVFSKMPEASFSDGDDSDVDSSGNESFSQDFVIRDDESLQNQFKVSHEEGLVDEIRTSANLVEHSELQAPAGSRKKLVLKLSVRDSRRPLLSESISDFKLQSSSSLPREEYQPTGLTHKDTEVHLPEASSLKLPQISNRVTIKCKGLLDSNPNHASSSSVDFPSKLSTGTELPVGVSYEKRLDRLSDKDAADGLFIEGNVAVNRDISFDLEENRQPVATRIKIRSSGLVKHEKTPKVIWKTGKKNLPVDSETKTDSADCGSSEDIISSSSYYDLSPGSELPDAETDVVRRSRSMELRASTRGSSAGTSKAPRYHSGDWTLNPNTSLRFRSTRSQQDSFYDEEQGTSVAARKISWLLLSEHEPGHRYIPQLGDQVAYLRQGHKEYIETCGSGERGAPWTMFKGWVKEVEICLVERLDYATAPGSGESCCKLTLKFIDPSSSVFDKTFKLTLPELLNAPDFLVEKSWYDVAMSRDWSLGDACSVWWRDEVNEGGSWWEGRIVSADPKSLDFPESPWDRFGVRYQGDPNPQLHSPWELHDPESQFENDPVINPQARSKVLDSLSKLERRKDEGLKKLEQVCQKPDFLNRFPVPISPDVIRSRLAHNYYRSNKSVKHDITVMMNNASSYFSKNVEFSRKMKRLADQFERMLVTL